MDDRQIIELYNERSETAISETADKYGKYCYFIAYHILYNEQDSEECVNDTYLRAWEAIPPQYPTLEWLEKYNLLSPEEQLAISYVPSELRTAEGGEVVVDEYEIEKVDYPPMVMFNDVLYTATNYSGDKENLTSAGKIESCIDYGVPTENNQANDALVGCEIYTTSSAPEYIFVLNNGIYSPYKAADGIE